MKREFKVYYDLTDNITFHGEAVNGQAHGYGISYYCAGHVSYKGQYTRGCKEGWGTSYHLETGAIQYRGEWKNNCYHGQGSLFNEAGELIYQGRFHWNKPVDYYRAYRLVNGRLIKVDSVSDGYHTLYYPDGTKYYEGELRENRFSGFGIHRRWQ